MIVREEPAIGHKKLKKCVVVPTKSENPHVDATNITTFACLIGAFLADEDKASDDLYLVRFEDDDEQRLLDHDAIMSALMSRN